MKKTTAILTALTVLAASGLANAQTSGDVAQVESNPTGTTGVTLTTVADPVITAIMSQPGTYGGRTYSTYAVLAQDSSGGVELFGALPSGDLYTPTVGDEITASGTYSPYHQIPELASLTGLSAVSTSPLPTPVTYTVPQANATTLPSSISGTLINLNDVTIETATGGPVSGNFPAANTTYTLVDGSGNTMFMYFYYTSYSVDGSMVGTPIPTGPVSVEGLDSVYPTPNPGIPEIIPYAIIPVVAPEPSTIALATLGGGAILMFLRRRN